MDMRNLLAHELNVGDRLELTYANGSREVAYYRGAGEMGDSRTGRLFCSQNLKLGDRFTPIVSANSGANWRSLDKITEIQVLEIRE